MRRDLLKRGVQAAYDHTGRLVYKKNGEKPLYSEETTSKYFRLKWFEKYYFKWMSVGRDMRVNIYAVFMCFVCFGAVFIPANYYDEKHYLIELKGRVPKDSLDKSLFEEYMIENGRSTRFEYDAFRHFQSG